MHAYETWVVDEREKERYVHGAVANSRIRVISGSGEGGPNKEQEPDVHSQWMRRRCVLCVVWFGPTYFTGTVGKNMATF